MENLDIDNREQNSKTLASILKNGYDVQANSYLKNGFALFKKSIISYIIFTLLIAVLNNQVMIIKGVGGILMLLLMPLQFGYFIYAHREFKNEDPDYKYFFEGYQKLFPIMQLYIFNIFVFLIFFILFYVPFSKSPDFATLQQLSMLEIIS